MRQFDIYESPSEASRRIAPFVVVMQSHFLDELPTVLVAPLLRGDERPAYEDVSIRVDVEGEALILSLAEMVAVDRRSLRRSRGSVRSQEERIRRALERVFTGF